MDKNIIIDGINVAGCVQLVEEPFYPCGLGGECKGWENCYYKQLKRLEQENKELGRKAFLAEQSMQTTSATFCEKDNKIIELEQENKRYKQLLQGCPADGNDCGFCEIDKRNKELKEKVKSKENELANMAEQANMRINTYRSALEEIREINNKWLKRWRDDSDELAGFEEIENKINEVLQ